MRFSSLLLSIGIIPGFALHTSAQSTFQTAHPANGLVAHVPLTFGGYAAVGNHVVPAETQNRIVHWKLALDGTFQADSTHLPPQPDMSWGAISATSAPANSVYVLYNTYQLLPGSSSNWNGLLRLGPNGQILWDNPIVPASPWSFAGLKQASTLSDGSCLVAGSSPYFPTIPKLMKVDATGQVVWSSEGFPYNTIGYNHFNAASEGADAFFATGRTHNNLGWDQKLLVSKVDPTTGAAIWSQEFFAGNFTAGDTTAGEGFAVAPTPDGGCLVGGEALRLVQGGLTSFAVVMRLDADGEVVWQQEYLTGTAPQPRVGHMVPLDDGNYLLFVHTFWGNTSDDPRIMCINGDGEVLWEEKGYNWYFGIDLKLTGLANDGGLLLAGRNYPAANMGIAVKTTAAGVYLAPDLWQPGSGSTVNTSSVVLDWNPTRHMDHLYEVQVATDAGFVDIVSIITTQVDTLVFDAQSYTTYHWRVRVLDALGNPGPFSSAYSFTTDGSVGIGTLEEVGMKAWPNPAQDHLRIQLANTFASPITLTVHDASGRIAASNQWSSHEGILSVDHMAPGAYVLHALDREGRIALLRFAKH